MSINNCTQNLVCTILFFVCVLSINCWLDFYLDQLNIFFFSLRLFIHSSFEIIFVWFIMFFYFGIKIILFIHIEVTVNPVSPLLPCLKHHMTRHGLRFVTKSLRFPALMRFPQIRLEQMKLPNLHLQQLQQISDQKVRIEVNILGHEGVCCY